VKGKPGDFSTAIIERFIPDRQCLQGKDLATLLRANGNPIRDRRTLQLDHRTDI
jgi:hypothetical protein